uniref:Uncharacterized protein n=1 Tax=Ciona savignyi TaxID=51511 RepID=H2YMY4_CIOSA
MNLPPSPQSDNIVKDESSAISSKPKGYVVVNVGNSVDDGIGFSLSNVSLDKNIDARKKLNDPIEEKFENENSIELGSMRKKSSKTRENITTDDSKSSKNKTNCDGSSVKSNRNQRRKKLKADQKNKDIVSTASAEVPPARNNKPSKKQNKESKKEETKQMLTSPSTSSPTVKSLELGDQLEEKKTTPNADILTDEVVQQILQKCDPLSDKKQKPVPKEKSQKKKKKKTKKTTSDERKQQENCFKENVQHQGELKDLSDPCNGYDIIADNCNDTMIWPHTDDFMMPSSYSSKVKTNLDSKGNSLASSSEECSSYTTGQSTPGINELAPDSGVQDIIGSMKPLVQEDFPPLSDFITVLHSKKIDPESGKNAATNDFTTPIGATDLISVKRDLNEDPILSVEVDTLLHNEWGLNFMPDNKELQLLPPFNLPCSSKIGDVPLTDCKDILFQHVDENQN